MRLVDDEVRLVDGVRLVDDEVRLVDEVRLDDGVRLVEAAAAN